jgi:hypothetical protein
MDIMGIRIPYSFCDIRAMVDREEEAILANLA